MCSSDWGSAIILILNGIKPEHLNMLEGGIIAKLLEEKWKTFAQVPISILFLLILTLYDSISPGHFLQADVCDASSSAGHVCRNLLEVPK